MNYLVMLVTVGFWWLIGITQVQSPEPIDYSKVSLAMCHTTNFGDDDMRSFANDPAFQALHPAPLPLVYDAKGKNIQFDTPDGKKANGYFIKSKRKSAKWLLVYQEWWGLNDYIRRQADQFYNDLGGKVNVLAVDMYDGKVTADPKEAGKIMSETKEERLQNIVRGASQYAGPKAQIANVGWCFGGSWSLRSALLCEKKSIGCVMYYGMPVRDVEQLKTLNCDVLGLFATEERISKQVIEEFAGNMKSAGKSLEYKIFDGVHGFANPSNPKYNETLAKEAYGMALGYLKQKYSL